MSQKCCTLPKWETRIKTLSNIDQVPKFFLSYTAPEICNKDVVELLLVGLLLD